MAVYHELCADKIWIPISLHCCIEMEECALVCTHGKLTYLYEIAVPSYFGSPPATFRRPSVQILFGSS
jgi:hypothetical protein